MEFIRVHTDDKRSLMFERCLVVERNLTDKKYLYVEFALA